MRNLGAPIPADTLAVIFDPFHRSERVRSSEGLGLNLDITQQIVLAHGGTVDVESTPEAGTTVPVTLPVAAPEG